MGFARAPAQIARYTADDNPEWREIYGSLARAIGDSTAASWFSDCKFVERTQGQLILAHWNAFSASECLRRFGKDLARIARVKSIRIYRSGGFRPAHLEGSGNQTSGFELYRVPDLSRKVAPPNMGPPRQAEVA